MTTIIQEEFAALLDPGCVANSCHDNSTLTRQGGLVSKRCSKCGVKKALQEFHKRPSAKDGLRTDCRACRAESSRQRRQTPESRAKRAEANRRWLENPDNRAKQVESYRRWHSDPKNRAKSLKAKLRYQQTTKARAYKKKYQLSRYQTDPQYRLAVLLRVRLRKALKGSVKSSRTIDLLGCTLEHLIHHLESRFQPGMSWLNQGEWHVDHIKPLKAFDLSDPEQQRMACHWSNLQPLWAADNIRKGAKYHQEATCPPADSA